MELILSDNPIIQKNVRTAKLLEEYKCCVNEATEFNIATGYITNDSIAALKQMVEYRSGELSISLFIGMNYIEGFTKPQYLAVRDLSDYLADKKAGKVLLSPQALFHGKMYSFMREKSCLASFVGSSNLGSFIGTSQNLIEADIMFPNKEGDLVNQYIGRITRQLGKNFRDLPNVSKFIANDSDLLRGYSHVVKLSQQDLALELQSRTGEYVDIPLKTCEKSNLNTYFGAGKTKDRYSPRGWYEVELIIDKKLPNRDILPSSSFGPFDVITEDGYKFKCSTQGDYSKNFRSDSDLKILGRWIKGQMENSGALQIGTLVTPDTLLAFKKNCMRLEKTKNGTFILSLVNHVSN